MAKEIQLPEIISVRNLADKLSVSPIEVVGKLVSGGVLAHINQDIDFDTASLVASEFGFEASAEVKSTKVVTSSVGSRGQGRPPIVTIVGHVDHGKTSLLDYIRSTNVVKGESGGITQNISAYQIKVDVQGEKREITFIDTPGHEAFSALRSHGVSVTDLVILVVAADDGIKPQTVEAINLAKAANVPLVVAITKADLPTGNIERVKKQLSEHELQPEDWGGQTVVMPVSVKTGQGIPELLEIIALSSDLLELKADASAPAEGIIIEAARDKQVGPVATVIVYNGTLRSGQVVVAGQTYGRIKALQDTLGTTISAALPAQPARIFGLKDVPAFGDRLVAVPNEKTARGLTASLNNVQGSAAAGEGVSVNLILKADAGGSLAALQDSINKLKHRDAKVKIIQSGLGQVSENDLKLAATTNSIVISFRATPLKRIVEMAELDKINLKEYWVIYEAIDFLTEQLKTAATPVEQVTQVGRLKVLALFSHKKDQAIVGGELVSGSARAKLDVKVMRGDEEVGQAKVVEVRMGKMVVNQAEEHDQCGLALSELTTVPEVGDFLELSETTVVK